MDTRDREGGDGTCGRAARGSDCEVEAGAGREDSLKVNTRVRAKGARPKSPRESSPPENLDKLLAEIRACRICAPFLPHGVRPIVRASATAKLCISAQAPG